MKTQAVIFDLYNTLINRKLAFHTYAQMMNLRHFWR